MVNDKTLPQNTATGYFKVKQNGVEIFSTNFVRIEQHDGMIHLIGNMGNDSFALHVDPNTPNGQHTFIQGQRYMWQAIYLKNWQGDYAYTGTFNSNFNNATKQYKLNFNLRFHAHDYLDGELEIAD